MLQLRSASNERVSCNHWWQLELGVAHGMSAARKGCGGCANSVAGGTLEDGTPAATAAAKVENDNEDPEIADGGGSAEAGSLAM